MKLVLTSVFIGLVLVGSISIQDGRGLFPDMGETINLISSNKDSTSNLSTKCQGKADCFDGTVTEVIDGDTLDVNNVRIRLALIDAPEKNETGYSEARHFVESLCKVGNFIVKKEDHSEE
jgi:endonuclease YncB( thermonuclease family)